MSRFSSLLATMFFRICYVLATLFVGLFFPLRVSGLRHVPRKGGVLVAANHQSYLDPVLIGLAVARPSRYLARSGLFRLPLFRWVIRALGAIKVEREGVATEGLKACLRCLEEGDAVVLYPEGTRTRDGNVGALRPGILLLTRRVDVPIVVAGIAGAYECWPRGRPLPVPAPIWVHFERWQPRADSDSARVLADLQAALSRAVDIASASRERLFQRAVPISIAFSRSVNQTSRQS